MGQWVPLGIDTAAVNDRLAGSVPADISLPAFAVADGPLGTARCRYDYRKRPFINANLPSMSLRGPQVRGNLPVPLIEMRKGTMACTRRFPRPR